MPEESFVKQNPSIVVGAHDGVFIGTPSIAEVADGWDTLREQYMTKSMSLPMAVGVAHRSFSTMRLTGSSLVSGGGGLYVWDLQYGGMLRGSKPNVVVDITSAVSQMVDDASIDGASYKHVNVNQNSPAIEVRSYKVNPARRSNLIGTQQTPTPAPPVRDEFWSSLADPVFNYPNGWVLMSSDVEMLAGTDLGVLSETFQYFSVWVPS